MQWWTLLATLLVCLLGALQLPLLATLLACFLGALWYMSSGLRSKSCSPREPQMEADPTRFLLTLLVQSRWIMMAWKLMFKHRLRLHRGQLPSGPEVTPPSRARTRGAAAMASMPGFTSADAPAPQGTRAASADASQPTPPPRVDPVHVQPEIPNNELLARCPTCGSVMIVRRNHHTHGSFWGCPQWPMCKGTHSPWDLGDAGQ